MRKIIILMAVVLLAALFWSKPSDRSAFVDEVKATETRISPFEIMLRRGKDLPVEKAVDPF